MIGIARVWPTRARMPTQIYRKSGFPLRLPRFLREKHGSGRRSALLPSATPVEIPDWSREGYKGSEVQSVRFQPPRRSEFDVEYSTGCPAQDPRSRTRDPKRIDSFVRNPDFARP